MSLLQRTKGWALYGAGKSASFLAARASKLERYYRERVTAVESAIALHQILDVRGHRTISGCRVTADGLGRLLTMRQDAKESVERCATMAGNFRAYEQAWYRAAAEAFSPSRAPTAAQTAENRS